MRRALGRVVSVVSVPGRRSWAPPKAARVLLLALCATAAFSWPTDAFAWDRPAFGRAGEPTLSVDGPREPIVADWPFSVTTEWSTGSTEALSVVLLRAQACGESVAAGLRADRYGRVLVDGETVTGFGRRVDEGTVTTTGRYLICAYLHGADRDAPAHVVAEAPRRLEITVHPRSRAAPGGAGTACGSVGGPRGIARVRAYGVSCRAARSLARRWGRASPPPAQLAEFRCRSAEQTVTCTASGGRRVTFRFARRPG
jgi:hypothetical protein